MRHRHWDQETNESDVVILAIARELIARFLAFNPEATLSALRDFVVSWWYWSVLQRLVKRLLSPDGDVNSILALEVQSERRDGTLEFVHSRLAEFAHTFRDPAQA